MYNVGDVIVHGEHGICRVTACRLLWLDGPNGRTYYTLHPYYQPEDERYFRTAEERMTSYMESRLLCSQ